MGGTSGTERQGDPNIRALESAVRKEPPKREQYNLAVVGLTGVGKSTLVNAVFERPVARTGVGEPITQGVDFYEDLERGIGLYDWQGIETGDDLASVVSDFEEEYLARVAGDPRKAIHAVWYCVNSQTARFDDGQAEIVSSLTKIDIPVLLVLTKVARRDGEVDPAAIELAESIRKRGLPIVTGRPLLVAAESDRFSTPVIHGLSELVDRTLEVAPEGVGAALAAAQRVSLRAKRMAANRTVATSASAAAAVGLAPIPGPDSLAIIPIQGAMLKSVSNIFDVNIDAAVIASAFATMAATFAGRAAFGALLKLVPGAGNIGAAAVAGSFTTLLGSAWTELCVAIFEGRLDDTLLSDHKELARALLEYMKERASGVTPSPTQSK